MLLSKVDVLAIGAHPDDVELGAGGTVARLVNAGFKVGILDLTRGELGTRGTPEIRKAEAEKAASILGVSWRHGLNLGDGSIQDSLGNRREVVSVIRACTPDLILANAIRDRHIDHGNSADLVRSAYFCCGLSQWESEWQGEVQKAHRPLALLNYIQDRYVQPNLVVGIDAQFETKMKAICAFESQFYQEKDHVGPTTPISTPDFLHFLEARARDMGRNIGRTFGEGFTSDIPLDIGLLSRWFRD